MCLEELVKCSYSGLGCTRSELLIKDDEEILDSVLPLPKTQEKGLGGAGFLEEDVHALSHLKIKQWKYKICTTY